MSDELSILEQIQAGLRTDGSELIVSDVGTPFIKRLDSWKVTSDDVRCRVWVCQGEGIEVESRLSRDKRCGFVH